MIGSCSTDIDDGLLATLSLFIDAASYPLHLCSLHLPVHILLDVSVDDRKCCGSVYFRHRRIFALVIATNLCLQMVM